MVLCQGDLANSFQIIQLLIKMGTDLGMLNNKGESVFDILYSQDNNKKEDIVNLMVTN